MVDPALTDHLIAQGRALVRAVEALSIIEPAGPFERLLARLLEVVDFYAKMHYTDIAPMVYRLGIRGRIYVRGTGKRVPILPG